MDFVTLRGTDDSVHQTCLCQFNLPLALERAAGPEATQGSGTCTNFFRAFCGGNQTFGGRL